MLCYVTDGVVWSVSWSVGLSVTIVSLAETAEPIKMPFGLWTRVGPRNYVLDGGPGPSMGRGNFQGEGRPIVKGREYCPCAAATQLFVKLL